MSSLKSSRYYVLADKAFATSDEDVHTSIIQDYICFGMPRFAFVRVCLITFVLLDFSPHKWYYVYMKLRVRDTVKVDLITRTATVSSSFAERTARYAVQDWLKANTNVPGGWTVWKDYKDFDDGVNYNYHITNMFVKDFSVLLEQKRVGGKTV